MTCWNVRKRDLCVTPASVSVAPGNAASKAWWDLKRSHFRARVLCFPALPSVCTSDHPCCSPGAWNFWGGEPESVDDGEGERNVRGTHFDLTWLSLKQKYVGLRRLVLNRRIWTLVWNCLMLQKQMMVANVLKDGLEIWGRCGSRRITRWMKS